MKSRLTATRKSSRFKPEKYTPLPVVLEGEPMTLSQVIDNFPAVIKYMDPGHDLGRLDASSAEPYKYKDVFRNSSVDENIANTLASAECILSGKITLAKQTFSTNADLDSIIDKLRKLTKSASFEHTFLNTVQRLGEKAQLLQIGTVSNSNLPPTFKGFTTFSEAGAKFPTQLSKLPKLKLLSSELDPAVCEPHVHGTVRGGGYKSKGAAMSIIFDKKTKTLGQVAESEQGKLYEFHTSLSNALISGAVGGIHEHFVHDVRGCLENEAELNRLKKKLTTAIISQKQGVGVRSLKRYKATPSYVQKENEMNDNDSEKENYSTECTERDRENAKTLANLIIDFILEEIHANPKQLNTVIAEKIVKKVLEYKSDGDYRQAADCVEVAGTRPVIGRSIDSMCAGNLLAIAMREKAPLSVILESNGKTTTYATTVGEIDSKKTPTALFGIIGGKKSSGTKKSPAKKQKRKTRRN
jgi:hypothetical protein